MSHFKALVTAIYPTADVAKAKAWYAEVFGVQPYFDQPFYVGFDIGGYELGLLPAEPPAHQPGNQGVVAYWRVDDCAAAHAHVLALGAKELSPVQDVGEGIKVCSVTDPDGNALGIIENPNFKK